MRKENGIIIIGIILLVIGLIIGYQIKAKKEVGYDFELYFFNAGKADAILVSYNGKYGLIDTGEEDLKDEILSYFQAKNIEKLEFLIITHFDKDHVGSASAILNNIEVEKVYQSNVPKESTYYTAYLEALASKEITPITVAGDLSIEMEDVSITINGPETVYDSNESNNSSLIVSITYQENKFLLMGDAQNPRIKDFLEINQETYDFLKVPYHGNYLKRLESLLETKEIKYAVITSSEEEKEAEETLELLNEYQVKTYLTRNGVVRVLSDGENIIIKQ